jgi:carotenoid cleavage dioxygenase
MPPSPPPNPFQAPPNPDHFGLTSERKPPVLGPASVGAPGRVEGEMADCLVLGEIPKEIDGTFYRIIINSFYPLIPGNILI